MIPRFIWLSQVQLWASTVPPYTCEHISVSASSAKPKPEVRIHHPGHFNFIGNPQKAFPEGENAYLPIVSSKCSYEESLAIHND